VGDEPYVAQAELAERAAPLALGLQVGQPRGVVDLRGATTPAQVRQVDDRAGAPGALRAAGPGGDERAGQAEREVGGPRVAAVPAAAVALGAPSRTWW
jgi:hypothetical protein